MIVSLKLNSHSDNDLAGFVRILTNNGYSIQFDRKGTRALMCRIDVSDSQIRYDSEKSDSNIDTMEFDTSSNLNIFSEEDIDNEYKIN